MTLSWLLIYLLAILLAYLLGSISFAVLVSTAMGLTDPRSYGSKNPGATNVLRSGNKVAALLTLVGDAFKGWLAVWLAQHFVHRFDLGGWLIALVALAVFIGHLYPVFLRFKGGKGVATAAGILLAINPWLGLLVIALWLAVAAVSRYSSLAAMVAALGAPVLAEVLLGKGQEGRGALLIAIVIMSVLLIYRHRANIGKLLNGSEHRIGADKDTDKTK